MQTEVMQVIDDARQLLKPSRWTNCFAIAQDTEGNDVWEVEEIESTDLLSLCGAIELATHRRGYDKAVSDAVVLFLYPIVWKHISVPYPYPSELIESHYNDATCYLYEEFGYFNDRDGRTYAEVVGVLNTALAFGYTKTLPALPQPRECAIRAFTELSESNRESVQQQLCELIADDSGEFGKAVVDHFPIEDGLPYSGDVKDFMQNWSDRDYDDHTVERALRIMELIYPKQEMIP